MVSMKKRQTNKQNTYFRFDFDHVACGGGGEYCLLSWSCSVVHSGFNRQNKSLYITVKMVIIFYTYIHAYSRISLSLSIMDSASAKGLKISLLYIVDHPQIGLISLSLSLLENTIERFNCMSIDYILGKQKKIEIKYKIQLLCGGRKASVPFFNIHIYFIVHSSEREVRLDEKERIEKIRLKKKNKREEVSAVKLKLKSPK